MGLFKKADDPAFWRTAPFRSNDATVLYQHGINCVMRSDGPGMMRTGWAIWGIAGLHQHQAWDFLYDGFAEWRSSADVSVQRSFVEDVFQRATGSTPPYPPDIYGVPQDMVDPASTVFRARCWSGMRLIELAERSGDSAGAVDAEARTRAALAGAHPDFLTPEAASFLRR